MTRISSSTVDRRRTSPCAPTNARSACTEACGAPVLRRHQRWFQISWLEGGGATATAAHRRAVQWRARLEDCVRVRRTRAIGGGGGWRAWRGGGSGDGRDGSRRTGTTTGCCPLCTYGASARNGVERAQRNGGAVTRTPTHSQATARPQRPGTPVAALVPIAPLISAMEPGRASCARAAALASWHVTVARARRHSLLLQTSCTPTHHTLRASRPPVHR